MLIVIRAKRAPAAIRGYLRRFLSEADRGLYIGNGSRRVAEALWEKITSEDLSLSNDYRATMILPSNSFELGFEVRTHGERMKFQEMEIDGIVLFGKIAQ